MKKSYCSLCEQKADVYTVAHKLHPFIDGNIYPKLCFSCFCAPKTNKQTYGSDGCIKEEISLSYSCENIHSARELFHQGSSDSLNQAKKSVESVIESCKKCKKIKETKKPTPQWIVE